MISIYLKLVKLFCKYLPPIISQRLRHILIKNNFSLKIPKLVLAKSVTGSFLRVDINDLYGLPFFVHGYYDWRALAVANAVCQKKGSIIEVGANIGTETIGFTDIVDSNSKVYAFEPVPHLFKSLEEIKLKKNTLKIFPLVISNENKLLKFNLSKNLKNSGIGHVAFSKNHEDRTINVRCRKLDSFLNTFKKINLIHIDAEGSDLNVIMSGSKIIERDNPVITAELSAKLLNQYDQNILDFLKTLSSYNYNVFNITSLGIKSFKKDYLVKNKNVVCIPTEKMDLRNKINRTILKSGLFPMLKYLNPLKLL